MCIPLVKKKLTFCRKKTPQSYFVTKFFSRPAIKGCCTTGTSKELIEIKKNLKLNLLQKKILPAILLGNAYLSTQDNGKTYRLHVYQSEKHKQYVFHLYDIFKEWCISKPKTIERTYKTKLYKRKKATMISFKTVSSGSFRFYAHNFIHENTVFASETSFYKKLHGVALRQGFLSRLVSPEKKVDEKTFKQKLSKKVPRLIHRWLTPISIAYWYMDHGSIKDKKSKAVYFNTQGFSLNEVKLLCEILQSKFNLLCKPVKKKDKYQIYISGRSYTTLRKLIYGFLLKEMLYKFPEL